MDRIVIVGGGAGGLELATQLGHKWGKKGKAEIHLVDANHTHLWKPLLHEVATGALDSGIDELNYQAHGKKHGFSFHLGRMCGLQRDSSVIELAAIYDDGEEILPQRELKYNQLVMALGSVTNDFGTKGAAEHCYFLDGRQQAEVFHQKLLNQFIKANGSNNPEELSIAIVGAGATGVELSAELYNTTEALASYNMSQFKTDKLKVSLVEAGPQILPALPRRISNSAKRELEKLGVDVLTDTMITEITEDGFITKSGDVIKAKLKVWAAGVKAPDFLANIGGLETNRVNQLAIKPSLQTTLDDNVFAIGDCAFLLQEDGKAVPPRAQAAHQQASHLLKVLTAIRAGKTPPAFIYRDKGSLVSLSRYSTVGSLMGNLSKGSMMIEGRLARIVYVSLYRLHQVALHGYFHTILLSLVGHINKVIRPRLKLH
ncbi:FAD-dependent oxidoreductase [Oleispira antarctica]|uniref:FAD-dependent oxidoreductase n=1 Tax=Oleispira antarctica TaxID=188908 RepID=A0A1Y5HCS7_OLEAN|nr:FAD-dependent oxidoreductase [Oleispira antarctica]